jgi:starvation-inducible outer membrane lipoprotein
VQNLYTAARLEAAYQYDRHYRPWMATDRKAWWIYRVMEHRAEAHICALAGVSLVEQFFPR